MNAVEASRDARPVSIVDTTIRAIPRPSRTHFDNPGFFAVPALQEKI